MPVPPLVPAERFASILRWLSGAVAAMSGGDRLSYALIGLIVGRILGIKRRFARLAARIAAGTYAPRHCSTPRRPPTDPRPRQTTPLPRKRGWLLPLVPETVVFRCQLENLLVDPEMVALLTAAPASLGRPIRSLCWMLRLQPPDILTPPPRPGKPRDSKPRAAPEPSPPPRPPLQMPSWWVEPPRRTRWSFGRLRGPPRRA
jgi:hypothetical protein